jgi:hypothetical protein
MFICNYVTFQADLYSGALFITQSVTMNLYLAVVILLAVSALFTIAGNIHVCMFVVVVVCK